MKEQVLHIFFVISQRLLKNFSSQGRKSDQSIHKLNLNYVIIQIMTNSSNRLNYDKFHMPLLNEKIISKKNIHSFYKRNDKHNSFNVKRISCVYRPYQHLFWGHHENRLIQSKDVFVRSTGTITLLSSANQYIPIECKDRLKALLSKDYWNISGQDRWNYR